MKNVYLVAYDVADPKRLRKTYVKLCGFGQALQYSVFHCELTPVERLTLKQELWEILDFSEDRIMIVDIGPAGGRGDQCIEFWGEPRSTADLRNAVIL